MYMYVTLFTHAIFMAKFLPFAIYVHTYLYIHICIMFSVAALRGGCGKAYSFNLSDRIYVYYI